MATKKETAKEIQKEEAVKETAKEAVVEGTTIEGAEAEASTEVAVKETEVVAASGEEGDFDFDSLGYDLDALDGLTGLETINASDIRVPYGKFWAVTKDGRIAGDLELPDGTVINLLKDGNVLKGFSILKPQTVRVMFPQPYRPTNSYTCRSLDGKVGAPDGEYAGHDCASCEFSKYPEEGGSSPCREQILLLCTLDDNTMFHVLVSGMSVGDYKKSFLSVEMMKYMALVKKAMKGRGVLAALNLIISAREENTDFGMKPVLQIRVDKEQPLNTPARIKANLDAYSSYKEFEQEAIETAATFARTEQTEYADNEAAGENNGMF